MRQFIAFTKKEWRESVATYRIFILLAVFLIFGMMSPLIAKLTPEIMKTLGETNPGIVIKVPEPTALDSWGQFFKNVGQMGILVVIIVFSGIMANELTKGTLINLLTKGLSRKIVILSKFLTASVLWLFAYLVCLGVCFGYTAYYWDLGEIPHAFLVFVSPWLFGEWMIALVIFGGTLFGNIYGSLLSCFTVIVVLSMIGILPKASKYNPLSLSGGTLSILSGTGKPEDFIPALIICLVLIFLTLLLSIVVFDTKRI